MDISIIIPAHNEEKRILPTLKSYSSFFYSLKQKKEIDNFEINVILNACKDRTPAIVEQAKKTYKGIKSLHLEKGGKGFAVTQGFKEALKNNWNYIGFVDADQATSPQEFYKLLKNIENKEGIIASRYLKGAKVHPTQPIKRIISSRIFNFLIRSLFLFPYKDTQCGAKIFKKHALEIVTPSLIITQWAFDIDLLYHLRKNNFKIKEYPTVWSDKEYSKLNFTKSGPKMIAAVIRLRLLNSPFKEIVRAYDILTG